MFCIDLSTQGFQSRLGHPGWPLTTFNTLNQFFSITSPYRSVSVLGIHLLLRFHPLARVIFTLSRGCSCVVI